MITALVVLFNVCAFVTLYIYSGYPLLLLVLSRIRSRPARPAAIEPRVSIVVPLHNEEAIVAAKIRNCLAVDYPHEKLEVLFVSDGSTDGTVEVAVSLGCTELDPRADAAATPEPGKVTLALLSLPRNGKAAALNSGVEAATGDILVMTDANVELAPDAVRKLVRWYADPDVGGVSGRKVAILRKGADTTELGENLYWRFDQWQKELESAIGSIFAADGTLYSLRRSLYIPIGDPAQADDIAISTRVVLQGFRLLFDREAVAYEEAPSEGAAEFRRKVRVTNHSVRSLLNLGSALWTSGFYSVELLSHKLVRHLIPFFLIPLFLSSALLALMTGSLFFDAAFAAQALFYFLAGAGALLRRTTAGQLRLLSVPYYFCLVNAAAFFGVLSIATGRRVHAWTPRGT